MPTSYTFLVVSVTAVGHVTACRGAARPLLARGHRVVFVTNGDWAGKLKSDGFEEYIFEGRHSNLAHVENPGAHLAKGLHENKVFGPYTPEDKGKKLAEYFLLSDEAIADMLHVNKNVEKAIQDIQPDVILVDNVVLLPAVYYSGKPWIRVMSFAPLYGIFDERLPPPGLGLPYPASKEVREKYRHVYDQFLYSKKINDAIEGAGYVRYADDRMMPPTQELSIYACPEELNFPELRGNPKLFNLEVFNKSPASSTPLSDLVPQSFLDDNLDGKFSGKLIYLSMGSMGSIDLDLMVRLVSILKDTPHKYIVSTGPRHQEYQLERNMWGSSFLPQLALLPFVDLVIGHGGNNSFTEAFALGKVTLVLPLFGDQNDVARRVVETGTGLRIDPYNFAAPDLIDSINQLLYDQALHDRMRQIAHKIETSDHQAKLCDRIEDICRKKVVR